MKLIRNHFEIIDSTNRYLKRDDSIWELDEIRLVTARQQTLGRGRFDRKWFSPVGNMYGSFGFLLESSSFNGNISQVLAISAAQVLEELGVGVLIKWPNDLMLEGKKIGGVLTETSKKDRHLRVVSGIGLNVNIDGNKLKIIDQLATSLFSYTGRKWDLNMLWMILSERFIANLVILKTSGLKELYQYLNDKLYLCGQEVHFDDGQEMLFGVINSVNFDGSLKIYVAGEGFRNFFSVNVINNQQ